MCRIQVKLLKVKVVSSYTNEILQALTNLFSGSYHKKVFRSNSLFPCAINYQSKMLWPCKHESHFDPALYHSTCLAFPNAHLQVFHLTYFHFDLLDVLN